MIHQQRIEREHAELQAENLMDFIRRHCPDVRSLELCVAPETGEHCLKIIGKARVENKTRFFHGFDDSLNGAINRYCENREARLLAAKQSVCNG